MRCVFIKNNGDRCEANSIHGSKFCYWHAPEIDKEEKQIARRRGGYANRHIIKESLPEIRIKNIKDIVNLLEDTINGVRSGNLEINIANSLGYLSSQLIKALEISDLERRLEEIEKNIGLG
ncbi:MAG: hypothetical protein ACFFFT_18060 [Candidatus Thorarchaeota archaeon]